MKPILYLNFCGVLLLAIIIYCLYSLFEKYEYRSILVLLLFAVFSLVIYLLVIIENN